MPYSINIAISFNTLIHVPSALISLPIQVINCKNFWTIWEVDKTHKILVIFGTFTLTVSIGARAGLVPDTGQTKYHNNPVEITWIGFHRHRDYTTVPTGRV